MLASDINGAREAELAAKHEKTYNYSRRQPQKLTLMPGKAEHLKERKPKTIKGIDFKANKLGI